MNDALTPIAVVEHDGGPWVEWSDLSGITPDDPFFEQTVARAVVEPDRRARNLGPHPRVHLVVDCVVNAWLDDLLTEALTAVGAGMALHGGG